MDDLIVAELIGTTSGITWFIVQQARYQQFDNVYAGILSSALSGWVRISCCINWVKNSLNGKRVLNDD